MILEHYSDSADPLDLDALGRHRRHPSDKPDGLWVSVAGPADWPEFCRGADFHLGRHRHVVVLAEDANLLVLDTLISVLGLHRLFPGRDPVAEMMASMPGGRAFGMDSFSIDWAAIAERWDGVLIPTYQYAARNSGKSRWYYSWDCASGCIWNRRAIAKVVVPRQSKRNRKARRKSMIKIQTLITAVDALLVSLARTDVASSDGYCDLAIDVARVRADRSEAVVKDFTRTADDFIFQLDDMRLSNTPEWQAASLALDAHMGRNQPAAG
jgi:hypothetical protein